MAARTPSDRDKKAIGSRFATARMNREMTQLALARRAGAHQSVVNRLEKGDRIPGLPTLMALARELGAPLAWFLDGKGELPELRPAVGDDRDQRFRK